MSNFIRTQPFTPNTTILIQELIINTIDALITSHNTGRLQVDGSNQMTGILKCGPTGTVAGSGGEIRLSELAANGADYIGLKAPDTITVSTVWTMPTADGTARQLVMTDGAKNLSFTSLTAADIPALDASKITTGVFATGQIPALDASKITTGVFATGQIPALDASKITTGVFAIGQIPALDASKITTGVFAIARGGLGLSVLGAALQVVRVNAAATALEFATAATGTVTSAGLSAPPVFSVTGSPVTSSGTLALDFAGGQIANQVLASPNGVAGAVGLRALVLGDIPILDGTKISASSVVQMARMGLGQVPDATAVMAASGQYFAAQAAQTTTGAAPTITVNWDSSNCHKITLGHTGTATVSLTNPKSGGRYIIEFAQDATGGRVVNYAITGVKWSSGTTPTQTTTANKKDVIALYYEGTDYIGSSTLNH